MSNNFKRKRVLWSDVKAEIKLTRKEVIRLIGKTGLGGCRIGDWEFTNHNNGSYGAVKIKGNRVFTCFF